MGWEAALSGVWAERFELYFDAFLVPSCHAAHACVRLVVLDDPAHAQMWRIGGSGALGLSVQRTRIKRALKRPTAGAGSCVGG